MNIKEALNVLDLTGEISEEAIKKAFRKKALQFHPDRNPAGEHMMQIVNAANDFLMANLVSLEGFTHTDGAYDYGQEVNDVLNALMQLSGLILEVIGNWVWISGDTRENKEALKEVGCMYAPKKRFWYYRPEEHKCARGGKKSIDEIREKYGSTGSMNSKGVSKLAA